MIVYGAFGNIDYVISNHSFVEFSLENMSNYSIHIDNLELNELEKFYFNFKIDYSNKPQQGSFTANINIKDKTISLTENYIHRYREVCFIQNFKKIQGKFIFKLCVNLLPFKIFNKFFR